MTMPNILQKYFFNKREEAGKRKRPALPGKPPPIVGIA